MTERKQDTMILRLPEGALACICTYTEQINDTAPVALTATWSFTLDGEPIENERAVAMIEAAKADAEHRAASGKYGHELVTRERERHEFVQDGRVVNRVCTICGKWELHHVHVSRGLCTCERCNPAEPETTDG